MGQVLPFFQTPPSDSSPRPDSHLVQAKSITASRRTALLVESNKQLQGYFKDWLRTEEYTVRTAVTAQEGLRLFQDFGPFNVVIIDYFIPENEYGTIDPLAAFQIHSVQLAKAIRNVSPTQEIVITARDYPSAAEVPLPPEVGRVRVLAGHDKLQPLLQRIEVEHAIDSLTAADWVRLKNFANYKIRGLGPMARDRDGQDLLTEAVYRTLLGTRRWKASVDFVHHLRETMRSVADQWKRRLMTSPLGDNTSTDSEGEEYFFIDRAVSAQPSLESCMIAEGELTRILELFMHDREADYIVRSAAEGLKRTDIILKYSLDEKRYAAALRRIRQTLRAHGKRGK